MISTSPLSSDTPRSTHINKNNPFILMTMEHPTKRSQTQGFQPQHENPDIASLATIGMRIRKLVADGYSVSHEASYDRGMPQRTFNRVPLPNNMDMPPPLTNQGSTFQSGSNVSEWGASMPLQTMPLQGNGKRGFEEDEPRLFGTNKPSLEQYNSTYGQLKFDEEF